MSRLFISHSSENDAAALAIALWLAQQGLDEVFLDIDPVGGLVPGQRWQEALREAADRCEAVLFLVSTAWLASRWCIAEFLLAKSLHKRIFGLIVAPVALDDIPVEMAAEWQLCDLTSAEASRSFAVTLRGRPVEVAFPQAGLALLRRGLERAGLDASSFTWPPAGDPGRAPYRGLRALEAEDAAIFFGRDAAVVRGLDRIRGLLDDDVEHTLVILGASGSGKSSFLRAGLWPRLARADTSFLPLPVIRPDVAAITGRTGLAIALSDAFAAAGSSIPPGRIKARLAEEADALGAMLDELLVAQRRRLVGIDPSAAGPAIIVSVDQAEELFNAEGATEAARFFDLLATALRPGTGPRRRLLILATMRSDRYELLQSSGQLAEVKRALFDLPPISPSEFKSVIVGPVQRLVQSGRRFSVDPALTEQLIADSQGADSLPLLAFTLERLYADFGAEDRLTLEQYDLIGRVKGSIEAGVDQALGDPGRAPSIPPTREAQFAALRAAFIPWLARIDPESGAPLRRVARLDELPEASRAVVERLIEARLLLSDRRSGVDVVEVAHESLLRQWPALTSWLEADRDTLKLVEGIERAAREWDGNARHEAWLDHRAARLASADELASRPDFHRRLGETGIGYLRACRAREDADLAAREAALVRDKARLRRVAGLVAAFGVAVVLGIGVVAYLFKVNADTQRSLDNQRYALFTELAATQRLSHNLDGALRLAVLGASADRDGMEGRVAAAARSELAAAYFQSTWRLTLGGHSGAVTSAAFSPDGAQVLTASADRTARLWDARTGAERRRFEGHAGELSAAAFSPDGTRIVTASADLTARVWDAATGAQLLMLSGHSGPVTSAAFDDTGRRIVTASEDGTAAIWDAATGARLRVLAGHGRPVWKAAFSADGGRVVTASEDGTARIWDASDGAERVRLSGSHAGGVWSAAFSPDGRRVVTASYDTKAVIWDAETGRALGVLDMHQDWVTSAVYSPGGRRVVTASHDGTARLWDVTDEAKPTSVATLAGHEGGVLAAAISPDGGAILTASSDRTARLWDLRSGTPLTSMEGHGDKIWSAAFSPDETRVVTASQDKSARIWDATSGAQLLDLEGHTRLGSLRGLQRGWRARRDRLSGRHRARVGRAHRGAAADAAGP